MNRVNLQRLGVGQFDIPPPPKPCGFSKNVSSRERVKPCFFVTFDIIIGYNFPENFIEILKLFRRYEDLSVNINYFHQLFAFSGIYLLQRNQWRQHITDNR